MGIFKNNINSINHLYIIYIKMFFPPWSTNKENSNQPFVIGWHTLVQCQWNFTSLKKLSEISQK